MDTPKITAQMNVITLVAIINTRCHSACKSTVLIYTLGR